MMLAIGALVLVCGLCSGLMSLQWDRLKAVMASDSAASGLYEKLGVAPPDSRTQIAVSAIVLVGLGIGYLVLGVLIRRGGVGAVYTSLSISVLVLAYVGLNLFGVTMLAVMGAGPIMVIVGCFLLVPLVALVILLILQIQAARNIRRMREFRAYQSQYWAYVQQSGVPAGALPQGQPPVAWPPPAGAFPGGNPYGAYPAPPPGAGPVHPPNQPPPGNGGI
jgi:hypothetical protein